MIAVDRNDKSCLSRVVDDLWERIGTKAQKQGVSAKDVERIIRETRTSRRRLS